MHILIIYIDGAAFRAYYDSLPITCYHMLRVCNDTCGCHVIRAMRWSNGARLAADQRPIYVRFTLRANRHQFNSAAVTLVPICKPHVIIMLCLVILVLSRYFVGYAKGNTGLAIGAKTLS